jgi:hypothetical protein
MYYAGNLIHQNTANFLLCEYSLDSLTNQQCVGVLINTKGIKHVRDVNFPQKAFVYHNIYMKIHTFQKQAML